VALRLAGVLAMRKFCGRVGTRAAETVRAAGCWAWAVFQTERNGAAAQAVSSSVGDRRGGSADGLRGGRTCRRGEDGHW